MLKLLVVEDQVDLAENIFEYLGEESFSLDYAADGLTALHLLATQTYDVVILDLMLPGVNGFEIARKIRQDLHCSTPIIMMTALSDLNDKEKGFDSGTDDYLVKPFELKELKLRIEALHRRHALQTPILKAGDIIFNPGTLEVEFHGLKAEVTGTPARLFEQLIRAYPNFLSHQALCDTIWCTDDDIEGKSLRTHIYALRKSLKDKLGHGMVKTVHGRGYRLESPCA